MVVIINFELINVKKLSFKVDKCQLIQLRTDKSQFYILLLILLKVPSEILKYDAMYLDGTLSISSG